MRKLICTDGKEVEYTGKKSMKEIRFLLAAYMVDTVVLKDRSLVMILDDAGHEKDLPVNAEATRLYWEKCGGKNDNMIRGDVFICPDNDFA